MTNAELTTAIEALGWHGLQVRADRVVAYHASNPDGWEVRMEPAPGAAVVLAHFLQDLQNPALLAKYA